MLKCSACGTVWPDELESEWGRTKESTGYGPNACCVAIVPAMGYVPKTGEKREGGRVCRGRLQSSNAKPTREVTPIKFEVV